MYISLYISATFIHKISSYYNRVHEKFLCTSYYNINKFSNLFNYKNKQFSVEIIMLKNKTCLNIFHHISSSAEIHFSHGNKEKIFTMLCEYHLK